MIFNVLIATLDGGLYLIDGVEHRGVILIQLLANVRGGQIGQLADQVDGNLPSLGSTLIFQRTAQDRLINGVELADLADNQAGGGQGVALALEHIVNGPGDVGQIQGHIVQIPVGHDLFYRSFNGANIVGDIDGNIVADLVIQIQTQMLCFFS